MSQNIRSFQIGTIFYQSGNGTPIHIATKGCVYIDVDTGTMYINKDGLVNWSEFSSNPFDYIHFNTGTTSTYNGGDLFWDDSTNSLSYKPYTLNNDVTVNLGQESLIRVFNQTGSQINNGKIVTITGASLSVPTISLAIASDGGNTLFKVNGVATHDIPNNSYGFITQFGNVNDINLSGFQLGERVYLSQTSAGNFVSYSGLSYTGRTSEVGVVLNNSVNGRLKVSIINESPFSNITELESNILNANNSSTGVFEFSGITKTSNTTFSVAPAKGWIIDNTTNTTSPTLKFIKYSGATNIDSPYRTTNTITYLLLTSGSTLMMQPTVPTPQQRRQNIFLGKIGHPDKTNFSIAFQVVDYDISPVSQLRDMFIPIPLINNGIYPYANANLTFNNTAGTLYGLGINFPVNNLNPNNISVSAQTPVSFQYRTQTGGTLTTTTTVDPAYYDNNGVRTIIPSPAKQATNQRVFLLQDGSFRIQYGQTVYTDLTTALANVQTETFNTFPNWRDNGILIAILSLRSDTTDLSDINYAKFLFVSKFGESVGAAGGLSTTNLQQAYNNSSEPEIIINSTLDGLSIKNGTGNADNVTRLLEGINSVGNSTSFIRADGAISGTSINTNALSAITISATTYQNLQISINTSGSTLYSTNPSTSNFSTNNSLYLGLQAGRSATGASYSNFFGLNAGSGATSASYSNFFGADAGLGAAGANTSNFLGFEAGSGANNASSSNFLGNRAGKGAATASQSNFLGFNAGSGATNASQSNFLGFNAGLGATQANNSIFIGTRAGSGATSAYNSIFLGYQAGSNIVGSPSQNNIIIGTNISLNAGVTNRINIGGVLFGSGTYSTSSGNASVSAQTEGRIGINVVDPTHSLHVIGDTRLQGGLSANTISSDSILLSSSATTINLNNTNQQQIKFYAGGTGTPQLSTYSQGVKIIFKDNIDSLNSTGYAIGVDSGSLWYGVDLQGNGHDWYAGTRKLASLIGSAGFQLFGLGGPTNVAFTISGTSSLGSKGGTGYMDFLRVANNWSGATNVDKWFRTNITGGLEILNSSYTSVILSLTDNGILSVGGGNPAAATSQDATSNYITFNNNNTQIYDDGNTHIHSRGSGQAMWINTNGGQLNLLTQSPTATGGIGSGIAIATGTLNGYVTINTGRTVTTASSYGYLTTGGAGTYPGGSQSISISLYANNRIWGQEIDAFSDERMKNIQGEITLDDGLKLVNNLKPIKYTWKEGDDKGLKAGYSAQQVIKSGFDHLVSIIPNEGLEETIDIDGFMSPKDTQFSMNYDQVTPYHGVVIKHLLEEIEQLKKEIKELKNK